MELSDDEFVVLIEADENSSPSDYRSRMDAAKHTNLVATHGYDEFTFTTRRRSFDEHGRIRYQQFSFEKDEFTSDSGKKYSALDKLNELEHGEPYKVYELYDKREVVKEFYEQFEELRRTHTGGRRYTGGSRGRQPTVRAGPAGPSYLPLLHPEEEPTRLQP